MARTAAFRADASAALGGGHIMRCLTLADALRAQGWSCVFACNSEAELVVPRLGDGRHGLTNLEGIEISDAAALRRRWPDGVDLLTIDHYELDAAYEGECRGWARRLLVIDDMPNRRHDCDLLLDQTHGRAECEYRGRVGDDCQLFLGAGHALLRPDFSTRRPESLARRGTAELGRILLSFGMVDAADMTSMAIAGLDASGLDVAVDVILGSAASHLDAVRRLAEKSRLEIALHVDTQDAAGLMATADLALGAAGSTSWERCCLGLPSIIVVVADNQERIAQALARDGAAIMLGSSEDVGEETFRDAVAAMALEPARLATMSAKASGLCDGMGTQRIAQALSL
jgi:UDP-2,4-diacetamido-2,4,6-trideoxy-beta-L-altropyranose hydrolase